MHEAGADDPLDPADLPSIADFDLDGDGAADTYAFLGGVQDQSRQRIYVLRGECGYAVGTVDERNGIALLPHVSHGLHDLQTIHFTADWKRSIEVTYRFDGHTYKEIAHRPAPPFRSRAH